MAPPLPSPADGCVLVTGGAGFIGGRLVAGLRAAGNRVAVLDDASAGLPLPARAEGLEVISGDIRDADLMARVVAALRPAAIVHLAALHHIPSCTADPRRALDINVVGTQSVLDAAATAGVERVLIASSGAVYDWGVGALSEQSPTSPHDIYALSKLTNEHQLALWARQPGRWARVARLFNVIGPGDPNGHLIPEVLDRLAGAARTASAGDPIVLRLGHLDHRRDYIALEDAAEGLIALLGDADPAPFSIDNLCSGHELGVEDLVTRLADLLGLRITCLSDPALRRANDRPSQLGAPERAWRRLGWRVRQPVDSALAEIAAADGRFALVS
ncbi:UDP-glucose 4-epimerase [Rhodospirillum rubrum]|uniref:NAD-dependent epimerase/dehydratase family protein n=1 Tax=Rhodospirillum rubrum TaxID=1085 RepID=UPI001904F797|nr:NAD-dependent epimerase/dehydratase family protein [Rhodospirillum rubrum]MBK1663178.1 UDP-glucose 4-epimerase [Rhodospirillum rubrum]MBK1675195.1 UDP-glucose 4-epimerase [Rhodospirillum rubrum]